MTLGLKKIFRGIFLTQENGSLEGLIKTISVFIGKMKIRCIVTGEKPGGSHPELIVCAVFNKVAA